MAKKGLFEDKAVILYAPKFDIEIISDKHDSQLCKVSTDNLL